MLRVAGAEGRMGAGAKRAGLRAAVVLAAALGVALLSVMAEAAAPPKHEAPIPAATLALMAQRHTDASAPILMRLYKKEAELEVWKRAKSGRYVHLKTFPICRWSGQLGPKRKQGDRQAPEGFYAVTPAQMNPNSAYHLSFDIGYPNAHDRAHGATGAHLMVHGACTSAGCFAMTDAAVEELFALARDAFAGGQKAFQFQAFPFRMTALNLARHRTDPNIAFWRELKEGSDRFEATGDEPAVGVAGGRYVFAPAKDKAKEALVAARRAEEEARLAALVAEGVAAVRTTYADGGQHPHFAALLRKGAPLGLLSRPEALAAAGREVVVIPARAKPTALAAAKPAGLAGGKPRVIAAVAAPAPLWPEAAEPSIFSAAPLLAGAMSLEATLAGSMPILPTKLAPRPLRLAARS